MRNFVVLLSIIFISQGCGDGLTRVPIQGLITAKGTPLGNATVQFTPKSGTIGDGAIGMSNAEGKFTVISSRQDDSGIPPGKYSVPVSKFIDKDGTPLPRDATQADYPDAKECIPSPFSTPSSPLEVTIDGKGGAIEIDIPVKITSPKK